MHPLGCVNFYGANPSTFPDTEVMVFCQNNLKLNIDQIISDGFGAKSKDHGISFIETGTSAWVAIFSNANYDGHSYVIPPWQAVFLNDLPMGDGTANSFFLNDLIRGSE